jgi:hypothetical protein
MIYNVSVRPAVSLAIPNTVFSVIQFNEQTIVSPGRHILLYVHLVNI